MKVELADVRQYCAEGVAEAEACGDVESHAEFLLMGALLNMQDGTHVNTTKVLIKVCVPYRASSPQTLVGIDRVITMLLGCRHPACHI